MDSSQFTVVGRRQAGSAASCGKTKRCQRKPVLSTVILAGITAGCLCCGLFLPGDPGFMDLAHPSQAPGREFWFGTDTMGRDIFSMIWSGGRVSLTIGFLSTLISTAAAILYGTASGLAPHRLDALLMRLAEIFLSIPGLLSVILIQSALGKPNVLSLSFAIGITGWMSIAKVIRTEVRRLRASEYVVAAKCTGGGFFHILRRHLMPNFISGIMFMVVMNVRSAIAAESALSFMGIGLPLEIISWGSMLSLAERALLSGCWWIIFIPGIFLVTTLLCVTDIGNYLRQNANRKDSYL